MELPILNPIIPIIFPILMVTMREICISGIILGGFSAMAR
jgi:hypothetical protein